MSATALLSAGSILGSKGGKGGSSTIPNLTASSRAESSANGSISGSFNVGGGVSASNYLPYLALAGIAALFLLRK